MLLALVIACVAAPQLDTAAPYVPPDRPERIHYVAADVVAVSPPALAGVPYSVTCADPGALVAVGPEGRLCSVDLDTMTFVDADGDGRCDLAPPVDLVVEVW